MRLFHKIQKIIKILSCCVVCNHFIKCDMTKYEAVYFMGDNQAINRVRVDSSKTRNRGAFSGSLTAKNFPLPKNGGHFESIHRVFQQSTLANFVQVLEQNSCFPLGGHYACQCVLFLVKVE